MDKINMTDSELELMEALWAKGEYLMEASRRFLDRNHGGSIVRMITALNGGEKLEKQEVEELKKMLSEWEKE